MGMLRLLPAPEAPFLVWDQAAAATGDSEAVAAVTEVERIVAEALARGEVMAELVSDYTFVRVTHFDPDARLLILLPRVGGG
jgi:hypothetical protein